MSLLLMDGLAENLLLELSALMAKSPEKCTLIKTGSIINLMFAAGEEVLDGMEEMKIQDLLNTFAVGTEKRKRSPGAPDQELVGPIRDIEIKSSIMKIKEKIFKEDNGGLNQKLI